MASASDAFRERYWQALSTYISGSAEEAELADTFGVGRAALDENRGLVDLILMHQSVLSAFLSGAPSIAACNEIIGKAGEFLAQVAAPFEMMHRGWRDAVDRLRELNESLERQVAERTAALLDSERRFQDIAEVSGDWMWETDREHRFTLLFGERIESLPIRR
jgi:PAS domain-containing protein